MPKLPKTTSKEVKKYIEEVLRSASRATIDRKLSSLKKFFAWAEKENYIAENPVQKYLEKASSQLPGKKIVLQKQILEKISTTPRIQKALYQVFYSRPEWYKKYHALLISRSVYFAILFFWPFGRSDDYSIPDA